MPYIAIPGILFLRDIIDWYHRTSFITNHNRLTTRDHMIQSYNKGWSNDQLQNTQRKKRSSGPSVPQATVDVRSSPSYHRRLAVHLHGCDTPLHSLAIWIARDKAVSTLKYSQTNTSVISIYYISGVLSSRFICIKPILFHKHLVIKDSSLAS